MSLGRVAYGLQLTMDSKSVSPPLPTRDDSETLEPASEAARLANSFDSLVQEPGDLSARRTSALPLTQENPQLPSLPQTLPVHRRPATPSSQRQTYASPQDSSAIPNVRNIMNPPSATADELMSPRREMTRIQAQLRLLTDTTRI